MQKLRDGDRIVRYVFPSKLFWFITIVFFALLWNTAESRTEVTDEANTEMTSEVTGEVANEVKVDGNTGTANGAVTETDFDAMSQRLKVEQYLTTWSPYGVLALVPVFALLVGMLFRRRELSYSDYLVFSLHFNSFVLLFMSVCFLVNEIFPHFEGWEKFAMWIPAIYLAVALRTVFRARIGQIIFRTMAIVVFYFILMIAIIVGFAITLDTLIN